MIFFETYWGWNGDIGDLMSVLLMSFMEKKTTQQTGVHFLEGAVGEDGCE